MMNFRFLGGILHVVLVGTNVRVNQLAFFHYSIGKTDISSCRHGSYPVCAGTRRFSTMCLEKIKKKGG